MKSIISNAFTVNGILNKVITQIRIPAKGKNFKVDYVPKEFNDNVGGDIGGFYYFEKNKKIKGWTTTENFYEAVDLDKLTTLMSNQKDFPFNVGDVFYIKESFIIESSVLNEDGTVTHHEKPIIHYKADNEDLSYIDEWENEINVQWKPSVHLKEKDARIFLKVTKIRIEILQDITYDDCLKEGFLSMQLNPVSSFPTMLKDTKIINTITEMENWYKEQWDLKAKDGSKWKDNPIVFVCDFERVEVN